MKWIYLGIAIMAEVVATSALRVSVSTVFGNGVQSKYIRGREL